jgi:cytochrome c-type biogenesis protein
VGIAGSYVIAFGGGVISFLSPCVLPLVPAYLSVVSGLDATELAQGNVLQLRKVTTSTLLFAAGFTVVFTALGLTASALGQQLAHDHVAIERVGGVILVLMALFLLVTQFSSAPQLAMERRFHPQLQRFGKFAAPVAGMAFAFGWTPCIGPILGSVLAVAATQSLLVKGMFLLLAYSVGLAVPFLVTGLLFTQAMGAIQFVKRHTRVLTIGSAVVLLAFGLLMAMNQFSWLTTHLESLASAMGLSVLNHLG